MSFERYLQNQVVINESTSLNDYDQKNFKNNLLFYQEGGLDKMIPAVLVKNGDIQVDMINQSIEHLRNTATDSKDMTSFYGDIYDSPDIDTIPVTTKVYNMGMITKINPQYLAQFVTNIGFVIDKFLKGRISKSEIENTYMSDVYLINCKKQMVITSIPYELDAKDLPRYNSSALMDVNQQFITGNILPFLRSIPQIVKDLTVTSANTISVIEKSYEDIQLYVTVADNLLKDGRIDVDTYRFLNKFLYKMIRNFMRLSSYLTFIMIKKISAVSLNLQSYKNLQDSIYRYFPDGKDIMHESVLDGSFSDMDMETMVHDVLLNDNSMFRSAINSIISREQEIIISSFGKMTGITDIETLNSMLNRVQYIVTPYKNALNIFNVITQGFNHIRVSLKVPNAVYSDIIEKSGLGNDVLSRFSTYINNISELHQYNEVMHGTDEEDKRNCIFMVFKELKDGIKNTDELIERIYNSYENYLDLKKEILNVNPDDDRNKETATEILDFLHEFDSDFRQLVLNVLNALISRFKALASFISGVEESLFPNYDLSLVCQEDTDTDIDDILLESELMIHEIDNKYKFNSLMLEYRKARCLYETGMRLVYEDEEQTTATQKKTMWERLKDAINNLFGKTKTVITDMIKKQSNKNLPLLQAAKEPLNGINYTGVVINVVPYEKYSSPEQMLSDIDKLTQNVNKLSNMNIRKYNSQKNLNQYLFNFMTDNVASSDKFGEAMNTYYKTKTQPLRTVAYRGETAKAHVQVMCDYCIKFYESFGDALTKKTDTLQKALDGKIASFEAMVESVVYEEGEPSVQPGAQPAQNTNQQAQPSTQANTGTQKNDQPDKPSVQKPQTNVSMTKDGKGGETDKVYDIMKMLTTSIQQYVTGVTRAARDRNFDYLKVLNPLIPQDVKDKFNGVAQEQQPEEQNTQQ